MAKIEWDASGAHKYETGVNQGVLYLVDAQGAYKDGVAWNGLTAVTESPEGAEATALYADDIKYLNLYSAEEFKATVEAYTYPDEFAECDGSAEIVDGVTIGQQQRKTFGLCYRTVLGNELQNDNYGYKIHAIYGAMASPSEKAYATINDSPEAITFSWELNTTPVNVTDAKPTATLIVDSTQSDATCLKNLEAVLYGAAAFSASSTYAVGDIVEYTESGVGATKKAYRCTTAITTAKAWDGDDWTAIAAAGPRLPLPDEIKTIMTASV